MLLSQVKRKLVRMHQPLTRSYMTGNPVDHWRLFLCLFKINATIKGLMQPRNQRKQWPCTFSCLSYSGFTPASTVQGLWHCHLLLLLPSHPQTWEGWEIASNKHKHLQQRGSVSVSLQRERTHSCDALGARARPRDLGEDVKDRGEQMNISPADSQSLILTSAPPAEHRSAPPRVSPLQAASGGLSFLFLKQSTLQTLISTPRQNVPLKLLFGVKVSLVSVRWVPPDLTDWFSFSQSGASVSSLSSVVSRDLLCWLGNISEISASLRHRLRFPLGRRSFTWLTLCFPFFPSGLAANRVHNWLACSWKMSSVTV